MNGATTGRKVWGKEAEQTTEPNPRYIAKLENHLRSGKVLLGRPERESFADNGREVSTLVSLERPVENQFVAGIEVYYTSDDVGSLSDDEFTFATLEEATAFVYRKTGIRSDQMYIYGQNRKPAQKQY